LFDFLLKDAPKKASEGLSKIQKGTGENAAYGLGSLAIDHNLSKSSNDI